MTGTPVPCASKPSGLDTGNESTKVFGDSAGPSSSLAPGPGMGAEGEKLKEDAATVERVSRTGGVEHVAGNVAVVPLHVVTNMRISVNDLFHDYPAWRVALREYADSPWKIVALRDVCQRVAGWIRHQDPGSERRGPRGGSGWGTKATLAEAANQTLARTNKDLLRRLELVRGDAEDAGKEVRRLRSEREEMLGDLATLRRDVHAGRSSSARIRDLDAELGELLTDRNRLRARLDDS